MRKYPKHLSDFISEHSSEYSISDMAKEIRNRLGIDLTVGQLRSYYKNHGLHALPIKGRKCPERKITTPEMDIFIREYFKGTGHQAMADLLNEKFGTNFSKIQIKNYYARNKLDSGLTGQFEKGHEPENKGKKWDEFMSPEGQENSRKTQFKPGHIPHNGGNPIGAIRLRHEHMNRPGGKPYYWEKVAQPNVWRPKHQLVWEEHNGPVPKGYIITFANGDTLDYRIENLVLATRAQNAVRNHLGIKSSDKETAEAANKIADLKIAIGRAKKSNRKGKTHEETDP